MSLKTGGRQVEGTCATPGAPPRGAVVGASVARSTVIDVPRLPGSPYRDRRSLLLSWATQGVTRMHRRTRRRYVGEPDRGRRSRLILLLILPLLLGGCAALFGPPNPPPEAVIDAAPTRGNAPLQVAFDAHLSSDDGTIVGCTWNFGDPATALNTMGRSVSHTYAKPGTYEATLEVVDDRGEADEENVAIVVTNPPPVAAFSISSSMPFVGEQVVFDADGSRDPNDEVTAYAGDFGDNRGTASGRRVSHSYIEAGSYTVVLTVTDTYGTTDREVRFLNVISPRRGGCGG